MTAWLGVEYFLAACVAVVVIDRFGRRKMMMFGAGGMATSLLVMGVSLSQSTMQDKTGAYVATVFIFVYNSCFALGWLGVTWVRTALRTIKSDDMLTLSTALSSRGHANSHSCASDRPEYRIELDLQLRGE